MIKRVSVVFLLLGLLPLIGGCAGFKKEVASWQAGNMGGDWIVAQFGMDGKPFNAWKLQDVSISNEDSSDGIFWQEPDGHLVHISGWYNRVQVQGGKFEDAAKLVGVDLEKIHNGRYVE